VPFWSYAKDQWNATIILINLTKRTPSLFHDLRSSDCLISLIPLRKLNIVESIGMTKPGRNQDGNKKHHQKCYTKNQSPGIMIQPGIGFGCWQVRSTCQTVRSGRSSIDPYPEPWRASDV
jgi:hypothetical protein